MDRAFKNSDGSRPSRAKITSRFNERVQSPYLKTTNKHVLRTYYEERVNWWRSNFVETSMKAEFNRKMAMLYSSFVTSFLDSAIIKSSDLKKESLYCFKSRKANYVKVVLLIILGCHRSADDNLLTPIFSGASSTGKSTLLTPFRKKSKDIPTTKSDVGSFTVSESISIVRFNDVRLTVVFNPNSEFFRLWKSLSRGSESEIKVHSSTELIDCKWVIVDTNDSFIFPLYHQMDPHDLEDDEKVTSANFLTIKKKNGMKLKSEKFKSTTYANDREAIENRILEIFSNKRCQIMNLEIFEHSKHLTYECGLCKFF